MKGPKKYTFLSVVSDFRRVSFAGSSNFAHADALAPQSHISTSAPSEEASSLRGVRDLD